MDITVNSTVALQWGIFEITIKGSDDASTYVNQYLTKNLAGIFIGPDKRPMKVPGFWDGKSTWRIRFAPTIPGKWFYIISDDMGIEDEGREGYFECVAASQQEKVNNPNLHGNLRRSVNSRYLEYADGTPFYWMGECMWEANKYMNYETEFLPYLKDRKDKKFSVVQICLHHLSYEAKLAFADRFAVNEGGPMYESDLANGDFSGINPEHFKYFDKRIHAISEAGMVPAIFLGWGNTYDSLPLPVLKAIWNYLIARYQAYNVIWVLAGEYGYAKNKDALREIGRFIQQTDAYGHLVSVHPGPPWPGSTSMDFNNEPWLGFHMQQAVSWTDHMYRFVLMDYNQPNPLPVVMAETGYEGERGTRDEIRKMAWYTCMAGGYYSYGATSLAYNFDQRPQTAGFGKSYPWQEALAFEGSGDMKLLVEFFTSIPWQCLQPAQELVDNGYCLAGKHENTGLIAVYLPQPGTVTIDIPSEAKKISARWYNPGTGMYTAHTSPVPTGTNVFDSPFKLDGVLLIECI